MIERACMVLLLAVSAVAQNASIRGIVEDPRGRRVPAASLSLVSDSLRRETITSATGEYFFPDLGVGSYKLSVATPLFKTAVSAVDLRVGSGVVLDFRLELSTRQDTMTVEPPKVDLQSGETARVITRQELRNTGLSGRNAFLFLGALPGATALSGYFQADFRGFSRSTGPIMVNGQRNGTTLVTLDGINHTEPRAMTRTNSNPGIDFVDEVTVLATRYAPEYGRTTGAQVQYVTRRGGAAFHAAAWEYLLHDKLIAQQFLIGGRPRTRYHNFGWTSSGPVIRGRMFFFAGQEFRRLGGFSQNIVTVPTVLERQRDFSRSAIRPVDPLAGSTPFPNGVIPESRLSRFGQSILRLYPEPNWAGLGGNYYSIRPEPQFLTDTTARIDYRFNSRWQMFGRLLHSKTDTTSPFNQTANRIPLFDMNQRVYGNNYTLAVTASLAAQTVNQLQAGYSDSRESLNIVNGGADRKHFGLDFLQEFFPGNRENRIPNVNIGGYQAMSGSAHPTFTITPMYTIRDNMSHLKGSHSLKAGFYLERPGIDQLNQGNDNGAFNFVASTTNVNNARNPLASAFLGYFDSYVESSTPVVTPYRTRILEFYAQDTWRARRNLSVEYGVRYSILPPWWSTWNNIAAFQVSAWDRAKVPRFNPNGSLVPGTGDRYNGVVLPGNGWPEEAKGNVTLADTGSLNRLFRGRPRGLIDTNRFDIQPRVSFSWDPFSRGRTALRGGGGVFHQAPTLNAGGFSLGGLAPFVEQITLGAGNADNLRAGIPADAVFPLDFSALPERRRTPTVYAFSLGVQRELPGRIVVDTGYVGNLGRFLPHGRPLNFLPPEVQRNNIGRDLRDLLPFPGMQSLNQYETSATSSYHSLQVAANKRMTHGLQWRVSYTWAKSMGYTTETTSPAPQDPTNLRPERSELEQSRRHVLVVTHLFELPRFQRAPRAVRLMLNGWTWSGTFLVSSGRRFDSLLTPVTGQIAIRPNVSRNPNLPNDRRTLAAYFDTAAFTRPAAFELGTAGRMILVGPGIVNYDASLAKRFMFGERLWMEIRGEAFNTANHPNPNGFVTLFGNRAFGQVNSFAPPRYFQVSGRLNW